MTYFYVHYKHELKNKNIKGETYFCPTFVNKQKK